MAVDILPPKPKAGKSFKDICPNLCSEWSKENKFKPENYSYGSNIKVAWECENGHKYLASLSKRKNGRGCRQCYVNSLIGQKYKTLNVTFAEKSPNLVKEWHPKNILSPTKVQPYSSKRVWWICSICNYEWQSTINNRSQGYGCKKCGIESSKTKSMQADVNNSLLDMYPEIAKEFSISNNRDATFYKPHSTQNVFWDCSICGFRWNTKIETRTIKKCGCPRCGQGIHSYGEDKIEQCLNEMKLDYKRQFKFDNCISPKGFKLKFDFAVFISNNINIIEYHGQQHFYRFKIISKDRFEYHQRCDKIKYDYCINNKIPITILTKDSLYNITEVLEQSFESR